MQKRTREILALVLLGVFALIGVGAMGYYILVGHNWNVAASNIDDTIGQMEGYTVILYEGTRPHVEKTGSSGAGVGKSSMSSASSSLTDSGASGEVPESAESNAGTSLSADDATGAGQSEPSVEASSSGELDTSVETSSSDELDELVEASGSGESSSLSASYASSSEAEESKPADIRAIASRYRDTGAAVFVVDAGDLARYSDPFIVSKMGKRIGFLAATRTSLRSAIRADARQLAEHDADYVVALTNDAALCNVAADGLIGNVSVIVCDDPMGKAPNGEYRGSTYCVSAPEIGEVGAVVISPSGVLSTKIAADVAEP